jgi:hypothetical protein
LVVCLSFGAVRSARISGEFAFHEPGAATLYNSTTSSGALDVRDGVHYGLKHAGGLMVFVGAHPYKGLAINHNTILVPITAGIRW